MRILYTGPLAPGETCEMRRQALERLGHETIPVDYLPFMRRGPRLARRLQWHLRVGPMIVRYNREILARLRERPDALWVDKGMFVHPAVLREARRIGVRHIVHYSPDNYLLRQNASRHFWRALPLYDLVVTTKRHNVDALRSRSARKVFLSGNAYDPPTHRPLHPDALARPFRCDVSFVGRFEPDREWLLEDLGGLGIELSIRGGGWQRARSGCVRAAVRQGPALADDYARAIAGARINLGLVSRLAADEITQRSIEIPACGGFMIAERTAEHLAHFTEGEEAVFFAGLDELRDKVRFYLTHERERRRIAAAGRDRCLRSGYSYDERLRTIVAHLESLG